MFSVVVPIYNHARYLRTAVQSCLTSPLVKEILLLDDGSSDSSAALAQQLADAHPHVIRNLTESPSRNRGAHIRLNQLCKAASQPWIAVLNSDDFFPAWRFDLAQLLARTQSCDLIAGAMLIVDQEDRVIGTKRGISEPEYPCELAVSFDGPLQTDDLRLLLFSQNFIATTSNILFRKTLFEAVGGFADLRYSHDWEFALRATMVGHCLWTPNFLTCYRLHGTNTIREQTPHMDGEVVRFFYRFLAEYPHLEGEPAVQQALRTNQHLAPYQGPFQHGVGVSAPWERIEHRYRFPATLCERARLNALLAIHHFSYDFLVVSNDLSEPPILHCSSMVDAVIHRHDFAPGQDQRPTGSARGRLLRIPAGAIDQEEGFPITSVPGWESVSWDGADIYFGQPLASRPERNPAALRALTESFAPDDKRPVCLVLPIYMAVGGVERNTIETIRHLRDEYRFVVVTTERLAKSQGSLHHQLDELAIPTFDLAEIGGAEHHLDLLATIAELAPPALVWICNGSPWLDGNALRIRRLFARVPIVDQQVYDTEYGWINVYGNKGIQAFDRFIAINRKIHEKLTRELRIPTHRVDLIYPAIGGDTVRKPSPPTALPPELEQYLEHRPPGSKLFAFVGRLTLQKRPLEFLEIAAQASRSQSTDRFVMIGDGELRGACEAFIIQNKLSNVTSIAYHPTPPDVLKRADGMIITSMFEGLPVAMLEALTVGTPVFSTDVGDIRLILEEYDAGSTVPAPTSGSDLFAAFTEWRRQLESHREKAIAACDQIRIRFSATTIAAEYRRCFNAAARSTHEPQR